MLFTLALCESPRGKLLELDQPQLKRANFGGRNTCDGSSAASDSSSQFSCLRFCPAILRFLTAKPKGSCSCKHATQVAHAVWHPTAGQGSSASQRRTWPSRGRAPKAPIHSPSRDDVPASTFKASGKAFLTKGEPPPSPSPFFPECSSSRDRPAVEKPDCNT